MNDNWLDKWEDRYRQEDYAFGTEPNEYLEQELSKLERGAILFAAEGEGRNAVFAAKNGWNVSAFDISHEGKRKALRLAEQASVKIEYLVGELPDLHYEKEQFDACALIYAHFPVQIRANYHKLIDSYVRTGGILIIEAFGKNHLSYRLNNEKVGGPTDAADLITVEDIKADFKNYGILELAEVVIDLAEGSYHCGKGSVTRFVGRKTSTAHTLSMIDYPI